MLVVHVAVEIVVVLEDLLAEGALQVALPGGPLVRLVVPKEVTVWVQDAARRQVRGFELGDGEYIGLDHASRDPRAGPRAAFVHHGPDAGRGGGGGGEGGGSTSILTHR